MKQPERNKPNAQEQSVKSEIEKQPLFERFIVKALLIIIILLLISLPLMLIKFNVAGIGETLRPFLENIKYVDKVLPPKPDPNDPKYMSKNELMEKYTVFKNDNAKLLNEIEELKKELNSLNDIKENYQAFIEQQKQLEQQRQQIAEQISQLEKDKQAFFNDIAKAKKTDFKEYFEKIDKEKAEQLYREIIEEQEANDQVKEFVAYYEKMDAENAAEIFNEMSKTQMDLVVNILKNMKKEKASFILANMEASTAASVSKQLSKEFLTD